MGQKEEEKYSRTGRGEGEKEEELADKYTIRRTIGMKGLGKM